MVEMLPPDAPLRFACICGYRAEFARAKHVEFVYANHYTDLFSTDCPACETARPAQVMQGAFNDQMLSCVSAGTFIDDPEKEPTGEPVPFSIDEADFEDIESPVDMALGVFIVRCGECDALLDEHDRRADEDAPEVGWEYYECSDCGAKTRADIAEITTT
jgi:hypothetical protein